MMRTTRSQAILECNNKVLFLKHYNSRNKEEYWMLPGGSVEDNEMPKQAICRELYEECGVRMSTINLIDYREGDGRSIYKQFYTYHKAFECLPEIKNGYETVHYRRIIGHIWVGLDQENKWDDKLYAKQIYPPIIELRNILSNR